MTAGVASIHFWDISLLNDGLREIAVNSTRVLELGSKNPKSVFEVTASRDYIVWGTARGKISVYTVIGIVAGEPVYAGLDYFLAREGNQWQILESGACTDAECQTRAKALFMAIDAETTQPP
ncbi:MAG: hypothetical protein AMXMBFR84_44410 [Candidatus Hydrogenedentota bacterium]